MQFSMYTHLYRVLPKLDPCNALFYCTHTTLFISFCLLPQILNLLLFCSILEVKRKCIFLRKRDNAPKVLMLSGRWQKWAIISTIQNKTKNSQSGTLFCSNKSSNYYALSSSIDHAKLRLQPRWHSPVLAGNNDGETIVVK